MKVNSTEYIYSGIKIDTEGWMTFPSFVQELFKLLADHRIGDASYEFNGEIYCAENAYTFELGEFLVTSEKGVMPKSARIGIKLVYEKGHREITIYGLDLSETGYIMSIPEINI